MPYMIAVSLEMSDEPKNIRSVVRLRKYLFVSVIIIVLFVLLKVRYFLIGLVHPFVYILKPI